jgi:hypothetical protein
MSDTPETDAAVVAAGGDWSPVLRAVAQRLERERDEARQQLRIAVGLLSTQPQFANKHPEDVLAFVKEGAK